MPQILCQYLKPNPNLKRNIMQIEDYMLAHQGIDPFEEIIKLLISKLFDEKINLEIFPDVKLKNPDKEVTFKTYGSEDETFKMINELFQKAKDNWPGIFLKESEFNIKPHILFYSVKKLQKISISQSGLDSLGEAFEALINPRIKGEKGQFFTPPQVVRMAVNMINPKITHKILDPACGSGTFLVETINKIIKENSIEKKEIEIIKFVKENIYGIDFDSRLIKIARTYMIIYGSGENNIHLLDTLNVDSWSERDKTELSNFDIIITNPPFAGRITEEKILRHYNLSEQSSLKKGYPKKTTREILFLERCIDLLKEGGKLGIVLPHGITNNKSLQYVREFIFKKGKILAVVSFDENMFKPYTSAKTFLLLFEKTGIKGNYPIFLALSEKSGKNSKGDYIFSSYSGDPELKTTINGKEYYIDSDTSEIAIEYWRLLNG